MKDESVTEKTYRIRPLVWRRDFRDYYQTYSAEAGTCSFFIERYRNIVRNGNESQYGDWGEWHWSYCINEGKLEGNFDCRTAKEGKRLAAEWWRDFLERDVLDWASSQT